MKNLNFRFPLTIIALSVVLGFFLNYRAGMTWPENLADMSSAGKIITYLVVFLGLFLWRNRKKKEGA